MTQDEIIRMAREAGLLAPEEHDGGWYYGHDNLERFAALVAAHEREACAKVCADNASESINGVEQSAMRKCAADIRARG